MQSLKLRPALLFSLSNHFSSNSVRSFFSSFSAASFSTQCPHSNESTSIIDYLNANFQFSRTQSFYISKRVSRGRFPQRPLSVLSFFKQIGFCDAQILSVVRQRPQILFADVDKILRPKIELFRLFGFEGSELSKFISKNSSILTSSLKKTLVPAVEAIRKIVCHEKDFLRVLHRCGWILPKYQKFMDNVAFLQSCGVVGSHLAMLLKLQPRLFIAQHSTIGNCVSRAVDMGFHENSRMLVHGIHTISSLSHKTFRRKLELMNCFGFSEDEGLQMFRRAPTLLRTSEKKLKVGMEFFLQTVMLPKSALVHQPRILMYSMEDRVLPRYRVFQLLISKNLCSKKASSYVYVLCLSEEMFLVKYISQFREIAEELLVVYKGRYLEA
ncbi:Mitochodrial transcription termination factor-related [Spatholobus suberectus]|nr:Mitochodrial transcription termination factor-related [Spatholobus suberectus]